MLPRDPQHKASSLRAAVFTARDTAGDQTATALTHVLRKDAEGARDGSGDGLVNRFHHGSNARQFPGQSVFDGSDPNAPTEKYKGRGALKRKPGVTLFRGWIHSDTSPSMAGGRGLAGIPSQYMLPNMPAGCSEVNAHYPPVLEDEEEDSIIASNHESASKSSAYILASPDECGQHTHFDQLMHDENNGEDTNPFACI